MAEKTAFFIQRKFIVYYLVVVCTILISPVEPAANDVLMLMRPPAPDSGQEHPVVYWEESWEKPRPVQFHFVRIDLESPQYEVFTMLADDPDRDGPAEAQLVSPLELVRRHGAVAAINANAFRHLPDGGEDGLRKGWHQGEAVDIAGLAVSYGSLRSPSEPLLSTFWFDHSGIPYIENFTDGRGAQHAVSGWIDGLLMDGFIMTKKNRSLHPRTLAGIDRKRRYLLLVIADGRLRGYSEGITLYEAALLMKEKGCHDAVNLDGGGSSVMIVSRDRHLRIMNSPSGGKARPVPVMLGVRQRAQLREAGKGSSTE
jgi:hypothetical protein